MIDAPIFMYQLFAMLFVLIIPTAMVLGALWILLKMLKAFVRSIPK